MSEANVTLVFVPRERFSYTQESLESIYKNTHFPFNLIYVDGNSPGHIKQYLENQSQEKGFSLIRTNQFLTPNQARNLGLSHVKTKYVVFVDNDVLVKPGWLAKLVNCAEDTGSWLVGPLTLAGSDFKTVHMAGGTTEIREKNGKKWIVQKRPYMNLPLAKVTHEIKKGETGLVELHCVLALTKAFETIGLFDEQLMSMCEEDDICMEVAKTGNKIYFEPESVISYVSPSPSQIDWSDLPFFFVRWSDTWCQKSITRCIIKWGLTEDSPFFRHTEKFVRDHRFLLVPRPKQLLNYVNYAVKRLLLLVILRKIMNWKASQSFSQQNATLSNNLV
ncbi:MAG: glycosyltransferase [Crocosphaera sp.]|nr:glycosyltransferase [Crocosphaera sp.]